MAYSIDQALRLITLVALVLSSRSSVAVRSPTSSDDPPNVRRPVGDTDLRYWLENMVVYHGFTNDEISQATGLTADEISAACKKFKIERDGRPNATCDTILILPYPGGRHPRLGFLDGAIRPQRETKVSVFTPWDPTSYVVIDLPEAVWSNLGLTYLAHTHVPTIWTKQEIELEPREWTRCADGSLEAERRLPNGISFGTKVIPSRDAVQLQMWLTNGTDELLSDLRVQMCVMLGYASDFEQQTNDNKVFSNPYVTCRSTLGDRWIISAWEPCHKAWANPPCPCLHSDPKFPDCAPGETKRVVGWLSFYEGTDIDAELQRIEQTGWSKGQKVSDFDSGTVGLHQSGFAVRLPSDCPSPAP
jgi:hypothetical protein